MSDRTSDHLVSSDPSTTKMSVESSNTSGKLRQKSTTILGKIFTRGQKEEPTPPPSRDKEPCMDESIYDQLEIKQNPAIRPLHRNAETLQVREETACAQSDHIPNLRVRSRRPDFITHQLDTIVACLTPGIDEFDAWVDYMQNYMQGRFSLSNPPKPPPINEDCYEYMEAPFPPNEVERNIAIAAICHGPYVQEQRDCLNELMKQASEEFNTSGVYVSIINQDYDIAESVICVDHIPRFASIAAHALLSNEVMVVADASKDWRFSLHPNVVDYYHTRFFAGAPMIAPTGEVIGVLWLSSRRPRHNFSVMDRRALCKYSERAVEILWANLPTSVETPPVTPTIRSTSSPISPSDQISVDINVNLRTSQDEIPGYASFAQSSSSPFSSSNTMSVDSPRPPPPRVSTQPWDISSSFSAVQSRLSSRDEPVQTDISNPFSPSPEIRSRKGRRVRRHAPSSYSPKSGTPSGAEQPTAIDLSSPFSPVPKIPSHEKLPIDANVSNISPSPTHLNPESRYGRSYALMVRFPEDHLEGSSSAAQNRYYDNMPDSPTLGSISHLSQEPLTSQGCFDITGLEGFGDIHFSNQHGMFDHINGFESQNEKSTQRVSMTEISIDRTDHMDISKPLFTDASFALKLWAQALGYDLLYLVELKPMRIGLSEEEIVAPGGMQTSIIASHGNFRNKKLNVRLHLDALRSRRAIVWSNETEHINSCGLLMSLDVDQFEIQKTATHGLVFGAFRKCRKVQLDGSARPIRVSAQSFKEVIKVGHSLKSILSSDFLPFAQHLSSRYGGSSMSSADKKAAHHLSARYPANEAHLVGDGPIDNDLMGFSLNQVSAALRKNTSILRDEN